MFGLSLMEFVVILVVLVLFVKPEELPKMVRFLTKVYSQVLQMYRSLMREFNVLDALNSDDDKKK